MGLVVGWLVGGPLPISSAMGASVPGEVAGSRERSTELGCARTYGKKR